MMDTSGIPQTNPVVFGSDYSAVPYEGQLVFWETSNAPAGRGGRAA